MFMPSDFTFVYVILLVFALTCLFFLLRWFYVFIKGDEKAYPNLVVAMLAFALFVATAKYFDVVDEVMSKF